MIGLVVVVLALCLMPGRAPLGWEYARRLRDYRGLV